MPKYYKRRTTGDGPFAAQDFGYSYMSQEMIEQLDLEEVDASYQPTLSTAVIKQQKYSAINAEYSQKISAVISVGIPVAKQDALVTSLRTQWKAAIISVSSS